MAVIDSDPFTLVTCSKRLNSQSKYICFGDMLCFSVNFDVQYSSTLASSSQCVRQAFHVVSARQYAHY